MHAPGTGTGPIPITSPLPGEETDVQSNPGILVATRHPVAAGLEARVPGGYRCGHETGTRCAGARLSLARAQGPETPQGDGERGCSRRSRHGSRFAEGLQGLCRHHRPRAGRHVDECGRPHVRNPSSLIRICAWCPRRTPTAGQRSFPAHSPGAAAAPGALAPLVSPRPCVGDPAFAGAGLPFHLFPGAWIDVVPARRHVPASPVRTP